MKIKKGDNVQIMLGKERGKLGKVFRVMGKEGRAIVEGLNLYKKSVSKKKLGGQTEGQIIEIAKSMNISNLMLVCPNCKKPTRVGFEIKDKEKLRICKKCKEVIK